MGRINWGDFLCGVFFFGGGGGLFHDEIVMTIFE
jgi:hypothetical protein